MATKRSMNNIFLFLNCGLHCAFPGSINRFYSGAEDIRTMTLHHLEEPCVFALYNVTLLLAQLASLRLASIESERRGILKGGGVS